MPEFAGTIPAVKERPRVTRRPTIPGPATPPKKLLVRKSETKPEKRPAREVETVAEKTPPAEKKVGGKFEQRLNEIGPAITAPTIAAPTVTAPGVAGHTVSPRGMTAATMPVKKPLVKRKAEAKRGVISANVAPTMPAKKPLVTKQAKAAKPERAKAANWVCWVPVAVGIALGSLAPVMYALATRWDPWGLRVVFPFVQLAGLHEFGISHELTRTLPQVMLYLQFPLEGLLVASNLRRGMRVSAALGAIPPLHFVGALVLWIVALGTMPPI